MIDGTTATPQRTVLGFGADLAASRITAVSRIPGTGRL